MLRVLDEIQDAVEEEIEEMAMMLLSMMEELHASGQIILLIWQEMLLPRRIRSI